MTKKEITIKDADSLQYIIKILEIDGCPINKLVTSIDDLDTFFEGFCYGLNFLELKRNS